MASLPLSFTVGASIGLPAGVTLQAIDGETLTSPTSMSHSFYTNRNLTTLTTNRPAGFPNWDDPAFFPVDGFYGLYGNNSGNFSVYLDLGLQGSWPVTGGMDFATMANNHIYYGTTPGDYNTGRITIGNGFIGFHTDESSPAGNISSISNALQDHRAWDLAGTRNWIVFGGINANGDAWTFYGPNTGQAFTTPNGTKRGVDNLGFDFYWFATANDTAFGQRYGSGMFQIPMASVGSGCTRDQMARGSHYGNGLDCLRAVSNGQNVNPTRDGSHTAGTSGAPAQIPLLPYIETKTGKWTSQQVNITGPELVWATWSAIIHGARRVNYFTDFGVPSDYIAGPTDQLYVNTKKVTGWIKNLAPILNSPFALGYCTVSPHGYLFPIYEANWLNGGIELCVKWYQGGSYTPATGPLAGTTFGNGFYIIATTRNGEATGSVNATFTINSPSATSVNVIGENRSINISGGQFTDTFATSPTVHIYQVVG